MIARRALALVVVLAPLALALAPVRADDEAEARFFDDLGRRAYARGHWEEALSSFLDAEAAAPSPRTLYNVALAAQLAHHDALAFSSFETYLEGGAEDDPHRRADAAARRDVLARALALALVTSSPAGAEIWVDRRELGSFGRTPRTLVLEPGPHTIELALADHDDAHLEVIAVRAQRVQVHASLAPHLGGLRVDVTPETASARIVRGGASRALTPGTDERVPVGTWTLYVTAAGFVERDLEVTVSRDVVEQRSVALVRVPSPTGRLLVSTGGVTARLSIDGSVVADTPARLDGVVSGVHHLGLEADGFVTWEGDLDVPRDRARHLSVTLVPRH